MLATSPQTPGLQRARMESTGLGFYWIQCGEKNNHTYTFQHRIDIKQIMKMRQAYVNVHLEAQAHVENYSPFIPPTVFVM